MSPDQRLEVLFEELAELAGQRNAIDGRIVEIVAEVDRALAFEDEVVLPTARLLLDDTERAQLRQARIECERALEDREAEHVLVDHGRDVEAHRHADRQRRQRLR